jgi:endonuclease/exonuclease/phosphatase family metal-dependent hydrolase
MDINLLKERQSLLVAQRQDVTDRVNQAVADLNAINGAIQECNYWLSRLEVPDVPELAE